MIDYTWRAYWLGRRLPQLSASIAPPNVVIGCAVHLFAVLSGYYLSRRYRAYFLMEVRDLWPQTFLDMGLWREGQLQVRLLRWLEQFLYKRAERIITLSPLTQVYLARYSKTWADKTIYIPNGTRVALFEKAMLTPKSKTKPIHAMYLGSMGFKNGIDLIIQAIRIVEQIKPGLLECTLIGDGPEKPFLQQTIQNWGLKNIKFESAIPRAQVPERVLQADILILVEREVLYGSSNKLFDYLASGKPIVCSVYAEHNNLVEQIQCGLAASPEDTTDLAEKLMAIARIPETERQAMGERGRAYVQQYHDYSVLAQRLADALKELDSEAP